MSGVECKVTSGQQTENILSVFLLSLDSDQPQDTTGVGCKSQMTEANVIRLEETWGSWDRKESDDSVCSLPRLACPPLVCGGGKGRISTILIFYKWISEGPSHFSMRAVHFAVWSSSHVA